jgi:translation initiation factor IF-3
MTTPNTPTKDRKEAHVLMNERIPFERIQLIGDDGKNLGVVARIDALKAARSVGLDLVIIAESGRDGFPIAKIMDFGKIMYARKKQERIATKQHKEIQVKEIKLRPKISDHDLETKLSQTVEFLKDGKRAKITITFRGREVALREERGNELFNKVAAYLDQAGLTKLLVQDKDLKTPQMWSRMYYLKQKPQPPR